MARHIVEEMWEFVRRIGHDFFGRSVSLVRWISHCLDFGGQSKKEGRFWPLRREDFPGSEAEDPLSRIEWWPRETPQVGSEDLASVSPPLD